jgi:hypothetical protein
MKNRFYVVTEFEVYKTDDITDVEIENILLIIDKIRNEFTYDLKVWYKIEIRNC